MGSSLTKSHLRLFSLLAQRILMNLLQKTLLPVIKVSDFLFGFSGAFEGIVLDVLVTRHGVKSFETPELIVIARNP